MKRDTQERRRCQEEARRREMLTPTDLSMVVTPRRRTLILADTAIVYDCRVGTSIWDILNRNRSRPHPPYANTRMRYTASAA